MQLRGVVVVSVGLVLSGLGSIGCQQHCLCSGDSTSAVELLPGKTSDPPDVPPPQRDSGFLPQTPLALDLWPPPPKNALLNGPDNCLTPAPHNATTPTSARVSPNAAYTSLTGVLQYLHVRDVWRLCYGNGENDRFGGSVTLIETGPMTGFSSGQRVRVLGELVDVQATGPSPAYRVHRLEPLP